MDLKQRNLDLKQFFDERADGYDDVHTAFEKSKRLLTDALPEDTRRVLDLGAGTGMELIPLFERFPDACVTAADISEDMLSFLKARPFADRVRCIVGDFFDTELGEGYDAVITTSVMHHFSPAEKKILYKKIMTALRPGGLYLNSDKTASDREAQDFMFSQMETNYHDYKHLDTPLTVESETEVLVAVGFTDITVTRAEEESYYLYAAQKPCV